MTNIRRRVMRHLTLSTKASESLHVVCRSHAYFGLMTCSPAMRTHCEDDEEFSSLSLPRLWAKAHLANSDVAPRPAEEAGAGPKACKSTQERCRRYLCRMASIRQSPAAKELAMDDIVRHLRASGRPVTRETWLGVVFGS
jgi:hypothetical protein